MLNLTQQANRFRIAALAAGLLAAVGPWSAASAVQVLYTAPAAGKMPQFGTVPYPNNLYFDGGAPEAGDGTLVNRDPSNPDGYEKFGLETRVLTSQDRALVAGLDRLDGFGVTSAVWFFFDDAIDEESLPGVPVTNNGRVRAEPAAADSAFLVRLGSDPAELIPVKFHFDFDVKIPNTLAITPLEGTVLRANTDYVAVVTNRVTSTKGKPVEAAPDFGAAKGTTLADAVAYVAGTLGVSAEQIAGMTVYRTQTTTATLAEIRTGVVDKCPTSVDFSDGLVFEGADVDTYFGPGAAPSVGVVASGFYRSPRLQGLDPTNHSHRDGSGGAAENDLPLGRLAEVDDELFEDGGDNGAGCDLTVAGTPDGLPDVVDVDPTTPDTLDLARVPVSLAVPRGTVPSGGWPVIIVQHGLGGHRSTTLAFAEAAAQEGFAVIGIDAVDHGLRWDETDAIFNFTDQPGQDGLPDGDLGSAVNFGFFEAFANIAAIRDNFRQTYVDLMALVRTLSADGFDSAVGVNLAPGKIFYLGISLGGVMGAGTTPYVPEVQAVVLDAAGGGQSTELLINSTIGAGALTLLQGIFGLDPTNPIADFTFFPALAQSVIDAGDGTTNAPHFFKEPFAAPFRAMNVVLLQDMNDQVVPNQSNEALAVAAGFELFDPHVTNLVETPRALPVAANTGFVEGNLGGTTTAAVFQVGPGAHAVLEDTLATLSLVPGFAAVDEFRDGDVQTYYPPLIRPLRVRVPGVLPDVLDWFRDVADNGRPGRFAYTGPALDYNSYQNRTVGDGAGEVAFFARRVNASGSSPYDESTPGVSITIGRNPVVGRITATRSTIGASGDAADEDLPPLASVGTSGVLPFFAALQRPDAPAYEGSDLTLEYTDAEVSTSGCSEADLFVARYNPLSETYDALPSAVDAASNTVRVTGYQGADGVYGVFCDPSAVPFSERLSGAKVKLGFPKEEGAAGKLGAKFSIVDPSGTVEIDPTTSELRLTVWEDRDTVLFSGVMSSACWTNTSEKKSVFDPNACGSAAGVFTKAKIIRKEKNGERTFKLLVKGAGDVGSAATSRGGGGTQIELTVDGAAWHTTGGLCKSKPTQISCSSYD